MKYMNLILLLFIVSCASKVILPADTAFNGIIFKADTEIRFSIDDDGHTNIIKGTLANSVLIKDVALKEDSLVEFYPSGELYSGVLAAETSLRGISFGRDTPVTFYKSGELESAFLEVTTVIDEREYQAKSYIEFYESGEVRQGTLNEFIIGIGMTHTMVGEELKFDIWGNVIIEGAYSDVVVY